MRMVHVEDFFHPCAGYQINILTKYLAKFGHEIIIITAETDKIPNSLTAFFGAENIEQKDQEYTQKHNIKIIRLPLSGFKSGRAIFPKKQLFNCINACKPDILFIHGNDTLTGMRVLKHSKRFNCPIIMDSHMLKMASTNKLSNLFRLYYRIFYTPRIKKHEIPVIRTQNDEYVNECLGIPLKMAPWISYGSDTMLFHPDAETKKAFRLEYGISDEDFVIVYTGKLDEAKGGKLLAQAFQEKFQTKKDVVLIAVGNISGEYGKEVERIFSESKNRIIRFPTQKYSDLARFYQVADLSVFAKQCSLSFYDAQACGLPVLSEDNNINVDRCSHGNGWNFKAGDLQDFRAKIEAVVNMPLVEYQKASIGAYDFIVKNYNYEDKAREYENIILREYEKQTALQN